MHYNARQKKFTPIVASLRNSTVLNRLLEMIFQMAELKKRSLTTSLGTISRVNGADATPRKKARVQIAAALEALPCRERESGEINTALESAICHGGLGGCLCALLQLTSQTD